MIVEYNISCPADGLVIEEVEYEGGAYPFEFECPSCGELGQVVQVVIQGG